MAGKNDDENLVSLKDWQKKKAEAAREAERQKPRRPGGGGPNPALAGKLVLAVFVLLILWLAMPAGYLNILTRTFTGG
ncbi:hypothetical protein [Rhizobium sp. C4]|uniref:hypothetical protein n=1 Tax=Rhizobium sp. C4 TaxID=1349800 RepID=UPI001E578D88|nr:hypothetical protein [Rhizobium sp. C4]MCD2171702.1 hypothetical protein [Rhizobium sp. C4]